MTLYNLLTLLFGSGVLVTAWRYLYGRVKENDRKTESVQLGVQALLRNQMIHEYNKYQEKGYAPIYAIENFENMWIQYHNLGANGVMDEIHKKFKALPTEPPKKGDLNYEERKD